MKEILLFLVAPLSVFFCNTAFINNKIKAYERV
ncbi:hypothetical protein CLV73_0323 [Chryseobacterium geocarposphaerae]|uniref:Uncharacterized protein n=1 Tax=Chryseobacterium geocarposphaerae TaxID=1416776 RepID=A0A2M9C6D1_9FLAO|nr:hypothetical protein CLV73_0323 [Chryseobacterium geocarposphaerae]